MSSNVPLDALARQLLKYLLVAGFGMMQAMMFALVLYLEPFRDIPGITLDFFRWLGFLAATPVVLYSARPFFRGAATALASARLTIDVPIAAAIGLVYVASLYQSLFHGHEVYFDSVTMLVFFLLVARFLEHRAQQRALSWVPDLDTGALPLATGPSSSSNDRSQDRATLGFVIGVLSLTTATAAVWSFIDPSRVLDITLAVLVVSCPCAFALAPSAIVTRTLILLSQLPDQRLRVRMAGEADGVRIVATPLVVTTASEAAEAEVSAIAARGAALLRQGQRWAIYYNVLALPVAAAGWVTPWMAALGMSFSSILVVLNALRIQPLETGRTDIPARVSL